ncbi:MAG TPA: hypothetical protein VJZ78_03265 [Anaerolineales bacterium]|nr:hypothetical protein [Anaerolineales bacterium]
MFRRRIPRAGRMPGRIGSHPKLQQANDLLGAGDFQGASQLFDELAQSAMTRNGPAVPHLLIQAGRAKILTGQIPEGIKNIKGALDVFAQRREWMRLIRTRSRAVQQLRENGMEQEAVDIESYLSDLIPTELSSLQHEEPVTPISKAISRLPVSCPGCGGPIRSDQVEWVDEVTAECPYCGRIMRN